MSENKIKLIKEFEDPEIVDLYLNSFQVGDEITDGSVVREVTHRWHAYHFDDYTEAKSLHMYYGLSPVKKYLVDGYQTKISDKYFLAGPKEAFNTWVLYESE